MNSAADPWTLDTLEEPQTLYVSASCSWSYRAPSLPQGLTLCTGQKLPKHAFASKSPRNLSSSLLLLLILFQRVLVLRRLKSPYPLRPHSVLNTSVLLLSSSYVYLFSGFLCSPLLSAPLWLPPDLKLQVVVTGCSSDGVSSSPPNFSLNSGRFWSCHMCTFSQQNNRTSATGGLPRK
jgi:hypothetical protein